jgi:hypothetical protein
MHALCCLAIALSACAGLPAQLQTIAKPSLPTSSGPPTSGALPAVALPRPTGACPPEKNHCVRATTWFWIEHALYGSAGPTTPVYEKDGKWVSYENGEVMSSYYVLRTQVAVPSKVKVHDVLIVWRPNDDKPIWPESEEVAQTPSSWVVMVVETVDANAATFTIQGRADVPVPLAAARSVIERKEIRRPGQK